jgi:hypothetical protein
MAQAYEHKYVDMGGMGKGQGRVVIETEAVGSCVAIATYDRANKTGHMSHLVLMGSTDDELLTFLDGVESDASDMPKLKAWVRGGEPLDWEVDQDLVGLYERRQEIVELIKRRGILEARLDVRWSM